MSHICKETGLVCKAYSNHQHKNDHHNEECKKQTEKVQYAHPVVHPRVACRVAFYLLLLTVTQLTLVEKRIIIAIIRVIGHIYSWRWILDAVSCNHNRRV